MRSEAHSAEELAGKTGIQHNFKSAYKKARFERIVLFAIFDENFVRNKACIQYDQPKAT